MRERITFIQKAGDALDPSTLSVTGGSVTGPELEAVREDRISFALDELPPQIQAVLEESHEIHIRWVGPRATLDVVSPLFSRLPPGFHLFYTPRRETAKDSTKLCSLLEKSFEGIQCSTAKASFTSLPSDRFSHSTAFQFFQPLPQLSGFANYVKENLCATTDTSCAASAERLGRATSLDISYDAISHALKVTSSWPYEKQPLKVQARANHRTEVGVLAADTPPNLEPHELGVSGLLTVLGQDSKPSSTLFAFPSRHRDAESTFEVKVLEPTGLHPTLQILLKSNKAPREDESCSPHAYFTFPRTIFADKYQLADGLFLASKNLTALRYTSQPVDLEAPDYAMQLWGSAVLLELAPPSAQETQSWTAEIPLHLRYLSPLSGGYRNIAIPYPAVFWACAAEEGTKFPTNPFDKVNLGYDGLFGPRTVFWHVEPQPSQGDQLSNVIQVPVLDLDKGQWVNAGTTVVILTGFAMILWRLVSVYSRPGLGSSQIPRDKKKQ